MNRVLRLVDWPMRAKMAALLAVASLLPLGVSAYLDVQQARTQQMDHLQSLLQARADQIVHELDGFHLGYRRAADRMALLPGIQAYCAGGGGAAKALAEAVLASYPAADGDIRGAALLGMDGRVMLATESRLVGVNLLHQSHVRAALAGMRVTSDVFVAEAEAGEQPSIAYMTPIVNEAKAPVCVAALWVRARSLWTSVKASNALAGEGSFAVLFDQKGIRIAHTYSDDIVFHPAGALSADVVDALVAERRFGGRTRALLEDVRGFPQQFIMAREDMPDTAVFRGFAPVNQSWNYGVARRFTSVPWTVFYMVPAAAFEAELNLLTRNRLLLAAAVMAVAGALGWLFAASILRPIGALSSATRSIAAGDLSARVPDGHSDELGQLGASFNAMAGTIQQQASALQRASSELEQRVQQRTEALTQTTQRLELEVAERQRVEAALRERDAGLRRAQEIARLAHVVTRPDGDFEHWSDSLPPLAGLQPADMPRSTRAWLNLLVPEDQALFRRGSLEARRSGARTEVDYRLRRPDGTVVSVHQVNEPMAGTAGADGNPFWFCTLQDVSDTKQAEADLRDSELRFRQLAENIDDVFWVSSADFSQIIYLSPAYERLWGRPREPLYRDAALWMEAVHPEDQAQAAAELQGFAQGSSSFSREYRIVRPDGSVRWIMSRGFPVLDDAGRPVRVAGVASDITGRREAELVTQRIAALVQSSDDAIIGKTVQGIITSWNAGAEKLFGYTEAEAIGQPMLMLIPEDRRSEEAEILARIAKGETVDHFETVRVRKDRQEVDISATISPIHDAQGRVVGISKIARDVTERKHAEARLQAQLERLGLLDQITAAVAERQDLQSIYQVAIRSLEERLPVDFGCVCSHDAPDHYLTVRRVGANSQALAASLVMPESSRIEIDQNGLLRCLGGELVYEADTLASRFPFPRRLAHGGLRSLVMAPLRAESGVFGMLVVARKEANAFSSGECEFLRQLSAHVALAAQQARLYGALQSAYDELRQTQQAVMQQERLRALGQMASGIAHDINNAISPILLYSESLLERETQLSERGRSYLKTIAQSIDDVAATVGRLREFYRQREPELPLAPVDVNPLMRQVAELTRARWSDMPLQQGHVIDLRMELADGLPAVRGVESEIREALINLVFNAVDAMPDGGTLGLIARLAPGSPPQVQMLVSDTGTGMDEATRLRCLEPFFTTKGERGTGLGLAMVYGMAQRHGAEMHIDSEPGRGTSIGVNFPVPASAGAAVAPQVLERPAAPLRILIVDDDPIVLKSVMETLEGDGHAVVAADGGQAGIDVFLRAQGTGERFDMVITDLGMPRVDGRQVAAAIKAASSVPVIMLTGWGQGLTADGDLPAHVDRLLSKPPKLQELRAAMARLSRHPAEDPDQYQPKRMEP